MEYPQRAGVVEYAVHAVFSQVSAFRVNPEKRAGYTR